MPFGIYRDHPRMCGDHLLYKYIANMRRGSPPHVRGPLTTIIGINMFQRITPACAGTTSGLNHQILTFEDHPRMCGDHVYATDVASVYLVSPPHVRGPRYEDWCSGLLTRITPACAGTTLYIGHLYIPSEDHPRMCGDHLVASSRRISS